MARLGGPGVHGAVLLDKPVGISSNRALQDVRKLYQADKAGHAGTLDPLASGLLVVLFGEGTKFANFLLEDEKEYLAKIKLGERTATGDAEGEVLERKAVPADLEKQLAGALAAFTGEIEQVPPMYSALKHEGEPLYALARRGESVARAARRVTISQLELAAVTDSSLEIRVRCSKGTYVRTLAEDIGAALGTVAHLAALRRTASGGFSVRSATGVAALSGMTPEERAARLIPLAGLLVDLPRADLDAGTAARFRNGQAVATSLGGSLCAVFGPEGEVMGLGRADGAGTLRPTRLVANAQAAEKARKTLF